MECVANYEVTASGSVESDDQVLRIRHPKGAYRARIKNIQRKDFSTPFLLSVHIYFEATTLDEAKDIADQWLADCLNMLAFTTGLRFKRHRIRQIVDASQGATGMRNLLMWSDLIGHEDPHPVLSEAFVRTIERLLESDMPPAVRRALRWYRLGVNETLADDQFMYFWFALEIVAEHQKTTKKVHDQCPKCHTPLYCETCNTHPLHRPYARQAIHSLIKMVAPECDDAIIDCLHEARRRLMHGSTLKEIEGDWQKLDDHIVDILGG